MPTDKRSWGHRIYRSTYPDGSECSAPGCENHPQFKIYMRVKGHARNLAYCPEHAQQFAKNYSIAMPRINDEEAEQIDLFRFQSSALKVLRGRIEKEELRRDQSKNDFPFKFSSTGSDCKESKPYVARLSWRNNRVSRYFFNDTLSYTINNDETVTVDGTYSVRPGSIVEKRYGRIGEPAYWRRYAVESDGTEIPVATKDDQERNDLVEKYLRREISLDALLSE